VQLVPQEQADRAEVQVLLDLREPQAQLVFVVLLVQQVNLDLEEVQDLQAR
jgi:hypothetical protein